jgi:Uma2 family endonuclease
MDIRRRSGFGEAPPQPLRFTNADVAKMYASGVLDEDKRIELIAGEIFEMPSEHGEHAYGRHELLEYLIRTLPADFRVASESSLFLFDDVEVRPDLYVFPRELDFESVRGNDISLIVEVMISSHHRDQTLKLPVYARAEVVEVWLADLANDRLHVYRQPKDGEFRVHIQYGADETVSPGAFPAVSIRLSDMKRPQN